MSLFGVNLELWLSAILAVIAIYKLWSHLSGRET